MARPVPHPHEPWIVECAQCEARNPRDGKRCSRNSCKTFPYCWQHLKLIMGLQVKLSSVANAGCGLIATQPNAAWVASNQSMKNDAQSNSTITNDVGKRMIFGKDAWISPYTGERLTAAQEATRYPPPTTGRYLIPSGSGAAAFQISIDAIRTTSAPARFANHTTRTSPGIERVRAKFASRGGGAYPGPWLKSTMRVYEGDEIWVNYGSDYNHAAGLMADERPPRRSLCR